jgi:hypothetical protein
MGKKALHIASGIVLAFFVSVSCAESLINEIEDAATIPAVDNVKVDPSLQVWEGFYTSDVHMRYHLKLADRWWWLNLGSKLLLVISSLFLLSFGFIHAKLLQKNAWWKWAGVIGMAASIAITFIPLSEKSNEHYDLYKQWTSLHNDWKKLRMEVGTLDEVTLRLRAGELLTKQEDIERVEPPAYFEGLIEKCQDETDRALGVGEYRDNA